MLQSFDTFRRHRSYYTDIQPVAKEALGVLAIEGQCVQDDGARAKVHEAGEVEWLKKVVDVISAEEEVLTSTQMYRGQRSMLVKRRQ